MTGDEFHMTGDEFHMTGDEGPSTWSIESASPLTLERLRGALILYNEWAYQEAEGPGPDHATEELMALVRQGDYAGFRALAACLMPPDQVEECWAGVRRHLRLPPIPAPPPRTPHESDVGFFEDVLMDEID